MNDSKEKIDSLETEEYQEKPSRGRYWTYIMLFTVLLFFCTFGITYSYHKGSGGDGPGHEVETGKIFFNYSDVNQAGDGIFIKNAVPIPDSQGKLMVGSNQYFDFHITATMKSGSLRYEVLIYKEQISSLHDGKVKIYLSQNLGSNEKELVLAKISDLEKKVYDGKEYYVVYAKTLSGNLENYSDLYRLRMWVDEKAVDYNDQTYSIKVDIRAYQVKEG